MSPYVRTLTLSLGLVASVGFGPAWAGDGAIEDGKLNLSVLFTYREDDPNGWRPMFEEANRLLYNATNGQLQLGTIQLHNCGFDKPDIDIWIQNNNSGAFANLLGLGGEGHIYLSQTHESSTGGAIGQFGLVHEIGHYVFGLFDEYKGEFGPAGFAASGEGGGAVHVHPGHLHGGGTDVGEQLFHAPNQFCTTDLDPIACLMDGGTTVAPNNGRTEFCTHAGLSTDHNEGVLVGDQIFVNYQEVYNGESCWETIARIVGLDAPEDVITDEPAGLDPIGWQVLNDLNYLVLAVDRSASMFSAGAPIQLAQEAGARIVDLLRSEAILEEDDGSETVIPGEFLSIIGFGPEPAVLFPLQEILEDATKEEAQLIIEEIVPNQLELEETDFRATLESALQQIEGQGTTPACSESIILLSDGRHNSGEDLTPVLEQLADRGIEVYAVGLGEDVNSDLLGSIADATSGQFFRATEAEDLPGVFTAIAAAVRSDGIVFALSDSTDGTGESLPFLVDSLAEDVTVISTWAGGLLSVELVTSTGERITVESAEFREDVEAARGPGFSYIRVLRPVSGEWTAELEPSEVEDQLHYDFTVLGGDRNIVIDVTTTGAVIGPLLVEVDVIADVPVAGAEVTGRMIRPDGSEVPIAFFDDGSSATDEWGDDGRYTGVFGSWSGDGTYQLKVNVVNVDGTGPDPNLPFVEEGADPPGLIPPFVREATREIRVDSGIWTVTGALQVPAGLDLAAGPDPFVLALELPDPADLEAIELETVRLAGGIRPVPGSGVLGDQDGNGTPDLAFAFTVESIVAGLGLGMDLPVALTGRMGAGLAFEASSELTIYDSANDPRIPLPGSALVAGDRVQLTWPEAGADPIGYRGYVSRDGGKTWELAFDADAATEFEWEVTGPETAEAVLLVEARSPERVVEHQASRVFEIQDATSGVGGSPLESGFLGVLPHPVRGHAMLRYALAQAGPVDLAIYDVSGRRVRTLVSANRPAGTHAVQWDTTDDHGRALSSGVYLYVLQVPGSRTEGRITVVR